MTRFQRRVFLKWAGAAALSVKLLGLAGCASFLRRASRSGGQGGGAETGRPDNGPIDRTLSAIAPKRFSGDEPDRTHRILWNKAGYIAGLPQGRVPEPSERVPLVVVGGGVSGLTAAYLLREFQPVVLERASRFGGNSRGESWQGLEYSIGAAYVTEPESGSPLDAFYREIGADKIFRVKKGEDPVVFRGKRLNVFWDGDTDPGRRGEFRRLATYFRQVHRGESGRIFPEIPIQKDEARAGVAALDRLNFRQHLEKINGGKLHPHIETALEHYCWSSLGAAMNDVSAACALNFYASEFGNICVAPGGNAGIAERILASLKPAYPDCDCALRTDSIVFDVKVVSDGVIVAYEDAGGVARSIHAAAVVMACPKFAAAKMVQELEPERAAAIARLRYNSYLVANVCLNRAVPDDFYDLFMLGDGHVKASAIQASADRQKTTDVVFGSFARPDARRSVLTLYRPLPYAGARGGLFSDSAYARYRGEFEEQVKREVLPLVGASMADVADLRITRWGHPLPVAAPGLIADGIVDLLRKPFRERVFFIDQDNWMLPAFETGTTEALMQAPEIAKFLKSPV